MTPKRPTKATPTGKAGAGPSHDVDPRSPAAFRARFNAAFARLGVSQNELARMLGTGQANIFQWLNGHGMPQGKHMMRLPEVLGVSAAWLLEGLGQPYRTDPLAPQKDQVFFGGAKSALAELEREVGEAFARVRGTIEAGEAAVSARGKAAAADAAATDAAASRGSRTSGSRAARG